jgi:MraZ protein
VATQPITYWGHGFSLQGDKGRFVVPAKLRKPIKDGSDGEKIICIGKHETLPCLTAFGTTRRNAMLQELLDEQERAVRTGAHFDFDIRAQQISGMAEVPFDDSGRFMMPRDFMELGKIQTEVYFHSAVRHFLIWNPDILATMGPEFDAAKAMCAAARAEAQGRKA